MTYGEFCTQVAPMVLEIENECRDMTKEEFKCFRDDVMQVAVKSDLGKKFMKAVLDMIEKNIFGTHAEKEGEVA